MDILNTITEIDKCNSENELCVAESLVTYYDKLLSIMEYSDQPIDQTLSIFQEGKIMDDVKKQGEGQSKGQKAFTFLFRFIRSIVKTIQGKLDSVEQIQVPKPESNPKIKTSLDSAKKVAKKLGKLIICVGGSYVTIEEYCNMDRMSLDERMKNLVNLKEHFEHHKLDKELSEHEKYINMNNFSWNDVFKDIDMNFYVKYVDWGISPSGKIIYTNGLEDIILAYNRFIDGINEFLRITTYLNLGSYTTDTDPVRSVQLVIRSKKIDAIKELESRARLVHRILHDAMQQSKKITEHDFGFIEKQYKNAKISSDNNDTKFRGLREEELEAFRKKYQPSEKMMADMSRVIHEYYDDIWKSFFTLHKHAVEWKKAIDNKLSEINKSMEENLPKLKEDNIKGIDGFLARKRYKEEEKEYLEKYAPEIEWDTLKKKERLSERNDKLQKNDDNKKEEKESDD